MADEVCGPTILDLVQEKGPLAGIPICVLVIDLAVRASDVCANQRHGDRRPRWSRQLRQNLQGCLANPLGVVQKLSWDVIACDNDLLAVLGGNRSFVGNGIQELAIEPEDSGLPVPAESLDAFLNDVLWAACVLLEVLLEDGRILLAVLNLELAEAQRERHHGLLHDEGLPATRLDLFQQLCRASLVLEGEYGRSHWNASLQACVHVL
mmetsp:Transcript_132404/g.313888  ORF Transcript_132404/g.313888 Transcript_132404/m.313888 type:complete len:208 (+) Transcript_132404:423-1046(+)